MYRAQLWVGLQINFIAMQRVPFPSYISAIWTKAIREVMGMPGARAIDIYNSAWGGEARAVREQLCICFVGQQYFGGQNVKNQYGSQHYKDGYESWIHILYTVV